MGEGLYTEEIILRESRYIVLISSTYIIYVLIIKARESLKKSDFPYNFVTLSSIFRLWVESSALLYFFTLITMNNTIPAIIVAVALVAMAWLLANKQVTTINSLPASGTIQTLAE